MKFLNKKNNLSSLDILRIHFNELQTWKDADNEIEFLIHIINGIRPANPKKISSVDLGFLIEFLQQNPSIKTNFINYLSIILANKKFGSILTDTGILKDKDFMYEVKKRFFAKLLPYQASPDTLEYVLNQVFYADTDSVWLEKIPFTQLEIIFELLGFSTIYETDTENTNIPQLIQSANLIAQRNSGKALDADVIKMIPEYHELESPFAAFEKELYIIKDLLVNNHQTFFKPDDVNIKQLYVLLHQCFDFIESAFQNSSKYGITMRVNQSLLTIKQQLNRLQLILDFLVVNQPEEHKVKTIQLSLLLIKLNCQKNNIRSLINESTQLISYEITQHTAKTGEKYITESKIDYFKMLYAALGGGFIVGILCVIKVLLSKLDASDFGDAVFYSLNYSFGFIAIYLLGYTLATKQPAMTAAALVRSLNDGYKNQNKLIDKYESFAQLFARVFRSQFIAFVGNVVMAFPVSLAGIWLIDYFLDYNIAATKWNVLITDLSPVHSLAIFHAAIAGVFLFLSGIISGSVSNRDKFLQVYYRIQEHPWLKISFGKEKAKGIAHWYEKKWAGVISNFWFGIFMGSTASLGIFLGLNLDIRHITFASGNLALALYGSNYSVSTEMILWGIFGIGIIGLINFMVSFSLSLGLAFRSRNIPVTELKLINSSILKQFKKSPLSFFFPVDNKK